MNDELRQEMAERAWELDPDFGIGFMFDVTPGYVSILLRYGDEYVDYPLPVDTYEAIADDDPLHLWAAEHYRRSAMSDSTAYPLRMALAGLCNDLMTPRRRVT